MLSKCINWFDVQEKGGVTQLLFFRRITDLTAMKMHAKCKDNELLCMKEVCKILNLPNTSISLLSTALFITENTQQIKKIKYSYL